MLGTQGARDFCARRCRLRMAQGLTELLAVLCSPEACLLLVNGQEGSPVGAEGDGVHHAGVRPRWLEGPAGRRVPETGRPQVPVVVATAGEDSGAVRAKGHGPNRVVVTQRLPSGLAGAGIPQARRLVLTAGHDRAG